jgi:UDP-glucose 4-epimerase
MLVITGGHGFIGSNIILKLAELETEPVLVLDKRPPGRHLSQVYNSKRFQFIALELTDTLNLFQVLNEIKREFSIIHLAANSDIKNGAVESKADFDDTLKSTISLIEAISHIDTTVNKFIFSSSSAVFGIRNEPLMSTDYLPKFPISAYGWAKLASEYAVQEYCSKSDTVPLILRFPNVVGDFQTHGFLFDLQRKLRETPRQVSILGNGFQSKPYIHVQDLSTIISWLINHSISTSTLNIGPDDQISIREIIHLYKKISNTNFTTSFQTSESGWPGDVPNYFFGKNQVLESICEINEIKLSSLDAISRTLTGLFSK